MSAFRDNSEGYGGDHECRGQKCGHLAGDYTPDAAELADEMLDWLTEVDENDFSDEDDKKLEQMISALAVADPEYGMADVEASWEKFKEKNHVLFEHFESAAKGPVLTGDSVPPVKKHFRLLFHKTAIIAATLVVFMSGLFTAQAFGADVFGAMARWTTEIFRFTERSAPYAVVQTNPLAENECRSYETLQEAVDAFCIDAPLVPSWIPEQFELSEVNALNLKGGVLIQAVYYAKDRYLRISFYEIANTDHFALEKDHAGSEVYQISGINHFIVMDNERGKAIWQNGELECYISGDVTEQELHTIIKSIYGE